jgi:hypothetical protein
VTCEQNLKLNSGQSSNFLSGEKMEKPLELKAGENSGEMSHSKSKFTLISRSGVAKDKKSLEKESRNCQKRIDLFLEEVVGVSSSHDKGLSVIASDLPFRCLRNLGTILSECCSLGNDATLSHVAEELRIFLEAQANAPYRRPLKSILEKMKSEDSNSGHLTLHVYLYSTTDDRFDMISYMPSILSRVMDSSNLPQAARQTSGGGNTSAGGAARGKLSTRGGAT